MLIIGINNYLKGQFNHKLVLVLQEECLKQFFLKTMTLIFNKN